jgi:hypothetical protein
LLHLRFQRRGDPLVDGLSRSYGAPAPEREVERLHLLADEPSIQSSFA